MMKAPEIFPGLFQCHYTKYVYDLSCGGKMSKLVVVIDGTVSEVTPWDGSPFENPPGRTIIVVNDEHPVQVGWVWSPTTNTLYPTVPTSGPRRVEKIDFMRLFTIEERVKYYALRKQTETLGLEDYMSNDPMKRMLVSLEVVFKQFDLAEKVELDHAETIAGMNLLAIAGIFGDNEAVKAERISQVLMAVMPQS